jgi:hypothetical protein
MVSINMLHLFTRADSGEVTHFLIHLEVMWAYSHSPKVLGLSHVTLGLEISKWQFVEEMEQENGILKVHPNSALESPRPWTRNLPMETQLSLLSLISLILYHIRISALLAAYNLGLLFPCFYMLPGSPSFPSLECRSEALRTLSHVLHTPKVPQMWFKHLAAWFLSIELSSGYTSTVRILLPVVTRELHVMDVRHAGHSDMYPLP